MKILGIDPGIATIGFGLIEYSGGKYNLITCGVITTPPHTLLSERLSQIYLDLSELIEALAPDCVAIEELFFNTNITTGISVAHGRGVILLACKHAGLTIHEYTPLQVKQAVAGYGKADKRQVIEMVKKICNLNKPISPDDAADAVALAICHSRSVTSLLYKGDSAECSTT